MKIVNLFFIIILTFNLSGFSQNEHKIYQFIKEYDLYRFNDLSKSMAIAKESVQLAKITGSDSLNFLANYNLVDALYKHRNIEKAKRQLDTCFIYANILKKPKYLGLAYSYKGFINTRLSNYEVSLKAFETALQIAIKNNFKDLRYEIIVGKVILLKKTKNPDRAIQILKNTISEPNNENTYEKARCYNLLGSLYFNFLTLQNKDSSAYFYKKAISLTEKFNNKYFKAGLYGNYADLLIQQKKFNEALTYLTLNEKLALEISNNSELFHINNIFGAYYYDLENYLKSIEKFTTAIDKYGIYAQKSQLARTYWILADAYYLNNDFKNGYLCQEKVIELKDSLFTIEKNKTFEKLQTEYEVKEKNSKIALLEKEKDLETQKRNTALFIGLLLLILLALVVVIYRNKIKWQKTIQLQQQKLHEQEKEQLQQQEQISRIEAYIDGQEKEKNRIATELHDGIGGQLAGLKHFASTLNISNEKNSLVEQLTHITKDVRLLSHSLSSNFSIHQPLTELLSTLKDQYKNHFSIDIQLYPEERIADISNEKKHLIHRCIQEIVNNIYKHAKASLVSLSLTISDELVLIIEDDGVGFNPETNFKGIGLANIKDRVAGLQGELSIDSTPGKGTSIIISVPM